MEAELPELGKVGAVQPGERSREFENVIDDPGNAGIVKDLTEKAKRMYAL